MLHTPVGIVRDIHRGFFSPGNAFCVPEDKEIIKTTFIAVGQVWTSKWGAYDAFSAEPCAFWPGTIGVARATVGFKTKATPRETA